MKKLFLFIVMSLMVADGAWAIHDASGDQGWQGNTELAPCDPIGNPSNNTKPCKVEVDTKGNIEEEKPSPTVN